jgi:citrate lyase gamma subunit
MGFMKYYNADIEEARQEHDFNVRYIMQKYLLNPDDYSDEYVEKIYTALEKNMLNCKYTVDDVTGTDEGYAVTVIIEPLNMQGITTEISRILAENGGSRDEASVYGAVAQAMDNMASAPVYDDAVSVVVRILPDENGQLSIEEDWDLLRDAMIIW